MNKLEMWFLKRLAKKLTRQGGHDFRITQYYAVMVRAACLEFCEDNQTAQKHFLTSCHNNAITSVFENRL